LSGLGRPGSKVKLFTKKETYCNNRHEHEHNEQDSTYVLSRAANTL